jgi:hypothetical protein
MARPGYWDVPPLWQGRNAFIIGGGPSLTRQAGFSGRIEYGNNKEIMEKISQMLKPIHGSRVIGVNNAFELGNWVDICFFGDCHWENWEANNEKLKRFKGLIVHCCPHPDRGKFPHTVPKILFVRRHEKRGIQTAYKDIVAWNGNSGGAAINLAYLLGAKRVILFGFDMKPDRKGDNKNFHSRHFDNQTIRKTDLGKAPPEPKSGKDVRAKLNQFIWNMDVVAKDAKRLGFEILNACPGSRMESFPIISIEEGLSYAGSP